MIRTQFEQLSGAIADEESKRAEAMNLVLGFVAAAIGAPDWADVVGVTSLPGMLGLAAVIFVLMFAVVGCSGVVCFRTPPQALAPLRLLLVRG